MDGWMDGYCMYASENVCLYRSTKHHTEGQKQCTKIHKDQSLIHCFFHESVIKWGQFQTSDCSIEQSCLFTHLFTHLLMLQETMLMRANQNSKTVKPKQSAERR